MLFRLSYRCVDARLTRDDARAGKQANPWGSGPAYGFPDIVDRASGGAVTPAG